MLTDFNKIETSIIIPCRNEVNNIEKCLNTLYHQSYPSSNFEIILVDGLSEDGTLDLLNRLTQKFNNLKVYSNPKIYTPHALNLGIKYSKGDYILILGAHAEYDEYYIENCVKILKNNSDVDCTGGPISQRGKTDFGKATAIAMSSMIGIGRPNHRKSDFEGYAEMACFPMFRKKVFDDFGLYDETLINNQDDEFCFRLRLNSRKIYITNKAKSVYYVRDNIKSLFKQYYNYGYWRVAVLKKHKIPISYRQQIPIIFYGMVIILFLLGFMINNHIISFGLPIIYLLSIFAFSISKIGQEKFNVILKIPIAISILHLSYALGFLSGLRDRKKI